MITLDGYKISEEIYNGPTTIIYKATDEKNNTPVIIKLLKIEYPTNDEVNDFRLSMIFLICLMSAE